MTDASAAIPTPIGRYGGAPKDVRANDLAAHLIHVLVEHNPNVDSVMYDLRLYRVTTPASSHGAWDDYEEIGRLPAAEAFLPLNPVCERAT